MSTVKEYAIKKLRDQKSVTQEIVEWFREQLVNGQFEPGDRLPSEEVLAKELGVGRTSVREAFKMLKALGVIETKRGGGTIIVDEPGDEILNPLSFQLLLNRGISKDLLQVRAIVEMGSASLLIQEVIPEDIKGLQAIQHRFIQAVESGVSNDKLAKIDMEFHNYLLTISRNALLIKIGKTIMDLFYVSMSKALQIKSVQEQAKKHHDQILTALQHKDLHQLKEVITESLSTWANYV